MSGLERCPTGAKESRCPDCWYPTVHVSEHPKNPSPPPEAPVKKPANNIVQLGIKIPQIPRGEWWRV